MARRLDHTSHARVRMSYITILAYTVNMNEQRPTTARKHTAPGAWLCVNGLYFDRGLKAVKYCIVFGTTGASRDY